MNSSESARLSSIFTATSLSCLRVAVPQTRWSLWVMLLLSVGVNSIVRQRWSHCQVGCQMRARRTRPAASVRPHLRSAAPRPPRCGGLGWRRPGLPSRIGADPPTHGPYEPSVSCSGASWSPSSLSISVVGVSGSKKPQKYSCPPYPSRWLTSACVPQTEHLFIHGCLVAGVVLLIPVVLVLRGGSYHPLVQHPAVQPEAVAEVVALLPGGHDGGVPVARDGVVSQSSHGSSFSCLTSSSCSVQWSRVAASVRSACGCRWSGRSRSCTSPPARLRIYRTRTAARHAATGSWLAAHDLAERGQLPFRLVGTLLGLPNLLLQLRDPGGPRLDADGLPEEFHGCPDLLTERVVAAGVNHLGFRRVVPQGLGGSVVHPNVPTQSGHLVHGGPVGGVLPVAGSAPYLHAVRHEHGR